MKKITTFLLLITTVVTTLLSAKSKIVFAEDDILTEKVKSYIVVDYNTGSVLLEKDSKEKYEIASMVKLMTTLLTMENIENGKYNLDTKFVVSEYASSMEGSEAFLEPNKEYTIDELLKSVIVASANDSSVVLAENIAGSEQSFVKMMNERAKDLGMNNTLYSNATGLPNTLQYSTAEDVAKLLKEIVKHKIYYNYSRIWMDKLIHYDGRETELVNTNRLIRQYKGCDIGKTGYTDEAGYCLSASATKNDMRLISVVMGAETTKERFSATEKLLNYGFNNYQNEKIIDSTKFIENDIKIIGKNDEKLNISYEKDFYYLCKKGEDNEIKIKLDLVETIKTPIKQGNIVGKAYITKNGVIIEEMNIISNSDISELKFNDILENIMKNWTF